MLLILTNEHCQNPREFICSSKMGQSLERTHTNTRMHTVTLRQRHTHSPTHNVMPDVP